MKELPKIIQEIGFDFGWSEEKVWELNVPTEEMPIDMLAWHFGIPFWSTECGYYDLKPQEVIDNPQEHKKEYERTMRADLKYPIDVMENKGRLLILDGLHRLTKAKIIGIDTVQVRNIPRKYIKDIKV